MNWKQNKAAAAEAMRLYDRGLPASAVAKQMSEKLGELISRNSIIGLVGRVENDGQDAGLPSDRVARPPMSRDTKQETSRIAVKMKVRASKAAQPPPAPAAAPAAPKPQPLPLAPLREAGPSACDLMGLRACICKFPVGAATGAEQVFCGAPTETDDIDVPYCPTHGKLATNGQKADHGRLHRLAGVGRK